MKSFVVALLLLSALANSQLSWHVVDSFPSCYTGLPFTINLGTGREVYTYQVTGLPAFAVLDGTTGIITGKTEVVGAYPVSVRIGSRAGQWVTRQYILNVLDAQAAQTNIWAGSANSYYERPVVAPLRVVASKAHSTIVRVGSPFSYKFDVVNAHGAPVYAFLNLPDGIVGDVRAGTITGTFGVAGIYTLGVETADQKGNSA